VFLNLNTEVKNASFSQYPHGPHGVLSTTAKTTSPAELSAERDHWKGPLCPPTAAGTWVAYEKDKPEGQRNIFVLNADANGDVTMDLKGCHDCSFSSAVGRLTPSGVELDLHFQASHVVDHQIGALANSSCELVWTTNSTDASGHWLPFYRDGAEPPAPPPAPPPGPPSSVYMGYTMVTRHEGCELRYTEWPRWIGDPATKGVPNWADLAGQEL
jgi:hypothetical protein